MQRKGYLRIESGSWLLTYRLNGVRGNAHRETVTVGPATGPGKLSKRQAETFGWTHYLSKVHEVAIHPREMTSASQFWTERYWPYIKEIRRLRASTLNQYQSLWQNWIDPVIGDWPIGQVRLEQTEQILADMRRAGMSSETIKHVKKVGSAVFSRAIDIEHYTKLNPFQRIHLERHSAPVRERYALEPDQARQVLEHELWGESSPIYRAAVRFAALTGCNVAEIAGLRWLAVSGDCIRIREQYYRGSRNGVKTDSRNRHLPTSRAIFRLLGEIGPGDPEAPVFAGRNGAPINGQDIQKRYLRKIGDKMGLPSLGWHIFRHTFATWLERADVRTVDCTYLMGHAAGNMTERYTHEDGARMLAGMERVAAMLEKKPQVKGKIIEFRRAS